MLAKSNSKIKYLKLLATETDRSEYCIHFSAFRSVFSDSETGFRSGKNDNCIFRFLIKFQLKNKLFLLFHKTSLIRVNLFDINQKAISLKSTFFLYRLKNILSYKGKSLLRFSFFISQTATQRRLLSAPKNNRYQCSLLKENSRKTRGPIPPFLTEWQLLKKNEKSNGNVYFLLETNSKKGSKRSYSNKKYRKWGNNLFCTKPENNKNKN